MATFSISLPGALLYCPDTGEAIKVGETIRAEIDLTKYTAVADPRIDLVVNSFTPAQVWSLDGEALVAGYIYNVTGDLPADLEELDQCDLTGWWCKSCCNDNVTASGESVSGSDEITVTLPTGYTAGHIFGGPRFQYVTATANGAMLMGELVDSSTLTSIVYKLTGLSNENGGHRVSITLKK